MKDKEVKWVGPDRRSTRPVEQMRDVNEHLTLASLKAQEEAEELAARYRDLVDDVDAIVWEAESDADTWAFTFVSQRAQTILGYPVDRWIEQPNFWNNLIHPDDRVQAITTLKSTATDPKEIRIEYRALASDGRVVWLAMIARVRTQGSGPAKVRGLMVDITESKRTEAMLQQLVRELETSRNALQDRNEELERFHDITVGRELKMMQAEDDLKRVQRELDALTSQHVTPSAPKRREDPRGQEPRHGVRERNVDEATPRPPDASRQDSRGFKDS